GCRKSASISHQKVMTYLQTLTGGEDKQRRNTAAAVRGEEIGRREGDWRSQHCSSSKANRIQQI
ncbi:hypothetical protein PIB30_079569, partial [Stylosanthes scabra]|nr:hypothetical protein [Stylosanthes scabra]